MLVSKEQTGTEDAGDIPQSEHTRNSPVDFSVRLPPEILMYIFYLLVAPDGNFLKLERCSYRFLLVCKRWCDVAGNCKELWGFWGSNLYEWSRRYERSKSTTPLDLVLAPPSEEASTPHINRATFDKPLQDALKKRVASNSIRSVHLETVEAVSLNSIVSLFTPDVEGVWYNDSSIESVRVKDWDSMNISAFLTRYHFPKLQHLHLAAIIDSSVWDNLGLHTTSLTSLSLLGKSIPPTTPQLLSVLASNPQLQSLTLNAFSIPKDNTGYKSKVSLPHLKSLDLDANFHSIFRLLNQLDHPRRLDTLKLGLHTTKESEGDLIPRAIQPYMVDHLHQDRFKNQLEISAEINRHRVIISAFIKDTTSSSSTFPPTQLEVNVGRPSHSLPQGKIWDKMFNDLASHLPGEDVVSFTLKWMGALDLDLLKNFINTVPNLQELNLFNKTQSGQSMPPNQHTNMGVLPILQFLHREELAEKGNWKLRPSSSLSKGVISLYNDPHST